MDGLKQIIGDYKGFLRTVLDDMGAADCGVSAA